MEGIGLALIGAALFSHSWHILGLFSDGRTVGTLMAAIGLTLLISLTFEPQIVGSLGRNPIEQLGEINVTKGLIVLWAIYAAIVAAQGIWDLEERALGFFSIALVGGSVVFLLFFLQLMLTGAEASVIIPFVLAGGLMSLVGLLLFFYMAIPFPALRQATGWLMLVGSIVVAVIGLAMITTVIVVV